MISRFNLGLSKILSSIFKAAFWKSSEFWYIFQWSKYSSCICCKGFCISHCYGKFLQFWLKKKIFHRSLRSLLHSQQCQSITKISKNGAIRRITGGVSTWQCRFISVSRSTNHFLGVYFSSSTLLWCVVEEPVDASHAICLFLPVLLVFYKHFVTIKSWILNFQTFSAATMTMFITATYSADAVLISLLITTGCSASIILFAATTKKDLTS